jgi:hypothetical protein
LGTEIEPIDLSVPIYLNQQIVFDLLAIIEDGFSTLHTIKTSSVDAESQKNNISGSVGLSNVFALLGVSFKDEHSTERNNQKVIEVSNEKVHTPTSLFAKLRLFLEEDKLIKEINSIIDIEKIESGEFIEFRAILKKNPLVDTMEGFKQAMEISTLFAGNEVVAQKNGKSLKDMSLQNPNQLILKKIEGLIVSLTQSNSLEVIGEMLDIPGVNVVLSAKLDYFSDRNATEIIDGEFRVLGKVVRVVKRDSSDSINLLRKTSLACFDSNILNPIKDAFAGLEKNGMKFPEIVTEIKGPALQVIPIAIFT